MIDSHTAVAVAAARARLKTNPDKTPMVVVSTAHPAKFGDAAARAGLPIPPLPEPLKDLMSLPEHLTPIRNDLNIVKNFVKTQARMS